MTTLNPNLLSKVVNPNLALAALHGSETHGEFRALLQLAEPEKHPSHVTVSGTEPDDRLNVWIPSSHIDDVITDGNVLRIELREFVSGNR